MTAELIQEIEEGDVRLELSFANTDRALLNRLSNNIVLKKAKRAIAQDPRVACKFLERAEILFDRPVEEGYLHPDDMALAAYLFLIGGLSETSIREFVHYVATSSNRAFRAATAVGKYMLRTSPQLTLQSVSSTLATHHSGFFEILNPSVEDILPAIINGTEQTLYERTIFSNSVRNLDLLHVGAA